MFWAWVVPLMLGRRGLGAPKPPNIQRIHIPVTSPHLSPGQLAPAITWRTLGGRVSLAESLPAVIDVYKPGWQHHEPGIDSPERLYQMNMIYIYILKFMGIC